MNKYAHAARQCATYFQVPLCAFAFGTSDRERLEAIISHGLIESGRKRWHKLANDERERVLEAARRSNSLPREFDRQRESHCIAVCGAAVTNVTIGTIRSCLARHAALQCFRDSFQERHGTDAIVRLKASLVFEARDGKGITPRELSILAAIYSVIGRKQGPVHITQDRIRCRALGYKRKAVMVAELPTRKDAMQPLSDWRLRTLLDRLQAGRCSPGSGRRLSYDSHR